MTAHSPCDRLEAYLAGQFAPEEEDAFEAHLSACDTCLDVPVLPDDLRADLASATCPPHVVTAALKQARRAPDRTPLVAAPPRQRVWGWAAAVASLLIAAALWVRPETGPTPTVVAEAISPVPSEDRPATSTAPPNLEPQTDPALPPEETTAPQPPSSPPPRSLTSRPSAPARVDPAPPSEFVAEAAVIPPDSVTAARDEVLLAFAIVADAQGRAAGAVADGVGRISDALHSTPHLLSPHTP